MRENAPPRQRIVPGVVDEVFAPRHPGARRRWETAALVVTGTFLSIFVGLPRLAAPSLTDWAALLAARVHAELARDPEVTIEPPPPPPVQEATAAPPPAAAMRAPRPASSRPQAAAPAPAQAASVIARASDAEPLDLTASSFVTGKGAAYAGGASSSSGLSTHAVDGRANAPAAGSRRRSVSLDESAWSCPEPPQAEGTEIVQPTVVLRVSVRSNGAADDVKIVSDPGAGFGQAARACALRTHFRPALDDGGAAMAAWSPPIRVKFVR